CREASATPIFTHGLPPLTNWASCGTLAYSASPVNTACPWAPGTLFPSRLRSSSRALNRSVGRSWNCPFARISPEPRGPAPVTVRSALNVSASPVFCDVFSSACPALSFMFPVLSAPPPPPHPLRRSAALRAVPPAAATSRRFMRFEPPLSPCWWTQVSSGSRRRGIPRWYESSPDRTTNGVVRSAVVAEGHGAVERGAGSLGVQADPGRAG